MGNCISLNYLEMFVCENCYEEIELFVGVCMFLFCWKLLEKEMNGDLKNLVFRERITV